jgi:hypothetical protein
VRLHRRRRLDGGPAGVRDELHAVSALVRVRVDQGDASTPIEAREYALIPAGYGERSRVARLRRSGGPDKKPPMTVKCSKHGKRRWEMHVICLPEAGGCGRVFQAADPEAPGYAPAVCPCGADLAPTQGATGQSFTARAICAECYKERA